MVLCDRFVPDDEVRYFFSAAEALVLPYRTATQSGVTQIAYKFDLPMVAIDVGGLPEIVLDGRTGIICRPEPESIADALERMLAEGEIERLRANFAVEKRRFSWDEMCDRLVEVCDMAKSK